MNEEVENIINLYGKINPRCTDKTKAQLRELINKYSIKLVKQALEIAKKRKVKAIKYIKGIAKNLADKNTDNYIDFIESNPVMKKCYDVLSQLYIPSQQEEYSTCKELIKLWTDEAGNIKSDSEIEKNTEKVKNAIVFFLPEYKKKIAAGNIQYVPFLHNFIAREKWKDAKRQQQAQSAPGEMELEYT